MLMKTLIIVTCLINRAMLAVCIRDRGAKSKDIAVVIQGDVDEHRSSEL
jgi:hypothetical protein